jgi:hypothetical protein
LLDKYPTPQRLGQARLASLENIPFMPQDKAHPLHQAAQRSVGSLSGPVAETLVRDLVSQVRQCAQAEQKMRDLLSTAFTDLPASGHRQLITIPGIGPATAAVLTAIDRFETANHLVGYFGIFPQESSSGVDKDGRPLPPGTMCMSPKGNDLVRNYLWNAARVGIRFNPALRALYARLKAKGRRGDVAIGHCMRKLLHLVFAVWKTNRSFDKTYFPWEPSDSQVSPAAPVATNTHATPPPVAAVASESAVAPSVSEPACANEKAAGHKREAPAEKVVTTATSSVAPAMPAVNPAATPAPTAARPRVDFTFLRGQVTMCQWRSESVTKTRDGPGHCAAGGSRDWRGS